MRIQEAMWFVSPSDRALWMFAKVIERLRNTGGVPDDEREVYPISSPAAFAEAVQTSIEARRSEGYPSAQVCLEDGGVVVYTTTSGRKIVFGGADEGFSVNRHPGNLISFHAGEKGSEELYSWIVGILGEPIDLTLV